MARFLIVDAHSMIFAWPELRSLHARRMVLAREALIRRLTGYQDYSGTRVVLVFDGQGARASDDSNKGGIQIFYSAQGQTADTVIERLVAKYSGVHDITVATGDSMVQQTVTSFGGSAVSAEVLNGMVEDAERSLQRDLKSHRRKI